MVGVNVYYTHSETAWLLLTGQFLPTMSLAVCPLPVHSLY